MKEMEKALEMLRSKKLKLYQLDSFLKDSNLAAKIRRKFLEEELNIDLSIVEDERIDFNAVVGRNIENPIGSVTLPLAIAGPLLIHGEHAKGSFYIPLATTEGALVASINRGCSAITRSGGAKVRIIAEKQTRAPVFKLKSIEDVKPFISWLNENLSRLKSVAEATSSHLKLLSFQPFIAGRYVYLRFCFDTCDAMGMNMATSASDKACRFIEEQFPWAKTVALSGNMCVDKKPSALNYILGRGKTVQAEAVLKREYIEKVLKTTPEDMVEVVYRKLYLGTGQAAAYGLNAHVANIIAAMWLATGQDAAHIGESSMGIVTAEVLGDGNLYISLTIPSMICGTIGGGMWLPQYQEALSIMGCGGGFVKGAPPGTLAKKFAEIACSAALAGEVSLIAALAAGHLAEAHERLGRGKTARKKAESI